MALTFNGTTSKLEFIASAALISALPVTIFAWIKPSSTALTALGCIGGLGDGTGDGGLEVFLSGGDSGDPIMASSRALGVSVYDAANTGAVLGWQPCMAVYTSTTSRTARVGTSTGSTGTGTNAPNVANMWRVSVGARPSTGNTVYFNGDIAEFAVWSSALTQTDYDALVAGASPLSISSGTLLDHWSLTTQAGTQTGANGRVLTATSTTQASDHPTVSAPPTPPTVSTQPSNASVVGPAAATFTVVGAGSGLSYQWQRQAAGAGGWSSVSGGSGGTTASYTTPATSVSGGSANSTDLYRCVITNSAGSVTSNSASLTVTAAATALLSSGASGGTVGAPSGTITITANGSLSASKTITASDGSDGSFTFASGTTLTSGGSVTCTYTPGSAGAKTLTFSTSDSSLTPVARSFTASTTTYSMTVGPFGFNTGSGPLLSTLLSYTVWQGVDTGAVSGTAINGTATTHATTGALVIAGLPATGTYLVSLRNADSSGRWHNVGTAA